MIGRFFKKIFGGNINQSSPEKSRNTKAYISWKSAIALVKQIRSEGNYQAAIQMLENLLAMMQNTPELKSADQDYHRNLAITFGELGASYLQVGEAGKAVAATQKALELCKVQGDSEGVVIYLTNLGISYKNLRDFKTAISYLEQAVKLYEELDIKENLRFVLIQLAELQRESGHYSNAVSCYQKTLEILRRELGEEHLDYAQTLTDLGTLFESMGQQASAEPLYRQALDIRRHLLGEHHPIFAISLHHVALIELSAGNFEIAERLWKQAGDIFHETLGEQDPVFVESLLNLAYLYESKHEFSKAISLVHQAIEITRTTQGENSSAFAHCLNRLGKLYFSQKNYTEAQKYLGQALEIHRQVLGEQNYDFAESLHNVAILADTTGDFSAATPLFEQAVQILRTVKGEEDANVRKWQLELFSLYDRRGYYEQAISLQLQLLEADQTRFGNKDSSIAIWMNNLAQLYKKLGNFTLAERYCQEALAINREISGEDSLEFASSLETLASIYQRMGDFQQAEPLFRKVLSLAEAKLGQEDPKLAEYLSNLANLCRDIGQLSEAESLWSRAVEILRRAPEDNSQALLMVRNCLGLFYIEHHNYSMAASLYEALLEVGRQKYGENHPDFAVILNNIAILYGYIDEIQSAEQAFQRALEIRRKTLGEEHPFTIQSLNNLAGLYLNTKQFDKAEQLYLQVGQSWCKVLGEEHPDYAENLRCLGVLYLTIGRFSEAEAFLRKALIIFRKHHGEKHPVVADSIYTLAIVCVTTDRHLEALQLMQEMLAIEEKLILQIFSFASEQHRLAYTFSLLPHYYSYLSLVFQYFANSTGVVQSALDLVLRRQAVNLDLLGAQREAIFSHRYPQLDSKLKDLIALSAQIAQKTLAGAGAEGTEAHQQRLAEWNIRKEHLETELAREIPEIHLQQRLKDVNRHTLAQTLPPGSALVVYTLYPEIPWKTINEKNSELEGYYLVFILLAGMPDKVEFIHLGEANAINQLVRSFRASLTGASESPDTRQLVLLERNEPSAISNGVNLRTVIFDPLLTALQGYKRLFLVPDGELTRLPFEVLPCGDCYLIDEYCISYLSAGRDLLHFGKLSSHQPTPPVVIADPDFNLAIQDSLISGDNHFLLSQQAHDLSESRLSFRPLPGTHVEGDQIASLLSVEPLMSASALKSYVKACRSPHILHLATHGYFLPQQTPELPGVPFHFSSIDASTVTPIQRWSSFGFENPLLRSGLALAGANTWIRGGLLPREAEDGILTAADVTGLDLLDTELVVLSACETGLGLIAPSEGVFGLRRAFVIAGANTLVMSLWKVPDQQTQELMIEFYRCILAGESRVGALYKAQLAIRSRYPHPFYWGAFICEGNPGSFVIHP